MKFKRFVIGVVLGVAAVLPIRAEHAAPAWFVEGRQEYDRLFHSADRNRIQERTALLQWGKSNRSAFACCEPGLRIADSRRGGALFLIFLAQQFWPGVLQTIADDPSRTFDAALANQTKPYELTLLFERFEAWLSAPAAYDSPADRFIAVNGVTLQHVDVHRFDPFAPLLTNRWHVVGYSRRGQGRSATPSSGYDTDTLVEDLRGFLDAMHFDRVDLIGHSLAGTEMTVFATRYPTRVRHLVYLDAAYDLASGREVAVKAHMPLGAGTSPVQQLNDGAGRTHLDFTALHVPALAFFVLYDRPEDPPGIRPEARLRPELLPYLREQVAIFRRDMKRGEAVELRNTDHTFFNDPRIQASVVNRVQNFLRR